MGGETIFVLCFISCLNVVVGNVVLYSVKRDDCVIRKCRYVMIWKQLCVCLEGYYPGVCTKELGETT